MLKQFGEAYADYRKKPHVSTGKIQIIFFRVMPSMPLLWLSSAFLLGILFESGLPLPPAFWGIAAIASLGWFGIDRAHGKLLVA